MTANGWLQIGFFLLVIFALTKPLGVFMAKVFNREKTFLDFALKPIERLIYRAAGVRDEREMAWTEYGTAMLLFSAVTMLVLYLMQRTQHWTLFNPQKLANVAPDLAWNTAASFTTNTNWQAYTPETTMSYLTQMAGLAYHNFASAAVGIALAIAIYARYVRQLTGGWRKGYVVSAVFAFYLNVFVLVVQLFQKIPALKEISPTQNDPPFKITQLVVLLAFFTLGVIAALKFHDRPVASNERTLPAK